MAAAAGFSFSLRPVPSCPAFACRGVRLTLYRSSILASHSVRSILASWFEQLLACPRVLSLTGGQGRSPRLSSCPRRCPCPVLACVLLVLSSPVLVLSSPVSFSSCPRLSCPVLACVLLVLSSPVLSRPRLCPSRPPPLRTGHGIAASRAPTLGLCAGASEAGMYPGIFARGVPDDPLMTPHVCLGVAAPRVLNDHAA